MDKIITTIKMKWLTAWVEGKIARQDARENEQQEIVDHLISDNRLGEAMRLKWKLVTQHVKGA